MTGRHQLTQSNHIAGVLWNPQSRRSENYERIIIMILFVDGGFQKRVRVPANGSWSMATQTNAYYKY